MFAPATSVHLIIVAMCFALEHFFLHTSANSLGEISNHVQWYHVLIKLQLTFMMNILSC